MDTLAICKAQSKQSGVQCKNYVTKGKKVCHIHGGKSTGSRTEEGRKKQKQANWQHGMRSKEAKEEAKWIKKIIKQGKNLISISN